MTTDLQILRASDVFVDNDVMRLRAHERTGEMKVAGAAWLAEGESARAAHRRSLSHVASLVMTKLDGYVLWLLAGHTAWQPDSRTIRHGKLWGSLKARGLVIPDGREVGEGLIEAEEGLRFFGALQLGLGSLDPVIAMLEAEPASHLVALRPHDEGIAKALVIDGWDRPAFGPNIAVLTAVCNVNGVVLWPVGAFDDREVGCAALAKPEVVDELLL